MAPPRFFIFDGSGFIYRAFYALGQLTNSKGFPTSAIYGFATMVLKIIREENPDFLVVAFDAKRKTFRNDLYPEYKANRREPPDELKLQFPYIPRVTEAFNIPSVVLEGYEADDIIGTLAQFGAAQGLFVTIVSGDKDLMQLVDDASHICLLEPIKYKTFTEKEVAEKFGVSPRLMVDYLALTGDSSDNVPGIPGIGPKTALELLGQFGSLEGLLGNCEALKGKRREKVEQNKDKALLSQKLVTIVRDVPIPLNLPAFARRELNRDLALALFTELEFTSLLKEVKVAEKATDFTVARITSGAGLSSFLGPLEKEKGIAVYLALAGENDLAGISLYGPGQAAYIDFKTLINDPEVVKTLQDLFTRSDSTKYIFQLKEFYQKLKRLSLAAEWVKATSRVFDPVLALYLLKPGKIINSLKEAVLDVLHVTAADEFDPVKGACKEAYHVYQVSKKLEPEIVKNDQSQMLNEIETPLCLVLAEMELAGVKIDPLVLKSFSDRLEQELQKIEKAVYTLVGQEFNINSPKQLQEILFVKLNLDTGKKTKGKTGYSTDSSVLEQLRDDHPAIDLILRFKTLIKLKTTYADALPALINPKTGRVHTTFNQTVTATGRLSSSDPNLQNIPVRTDLGREIRKAFIAENGYQLLSADYSQIELRILAHISKDPLFVEAFSRNQDIHRRTASEIFQVFPEMVTDEMRRMAKTINFGIIYGMSSFRLSQEFRLPLKQAKRYIDEYFERYAGIAGYMEKTLAFADQNGYVVTLFGRRRIIPELRSQNKNIRSNGERIAINTPIQGTAADIIKMAMIALAGYVKDQGLKSRLILQVHDELIFEVCREELEIMETLVRQVM